MTKQELSENYSYATLAIHRLTDELYENLHTAAGEPVANWERIMDLVKQYKKEMTMELDLIKSALDEFSS